MIYLTTLTKNLPTDTLKEILSDTPGLYEANVLRLRSNLDEVSEKLPDMELPDEFRTDCYDELIRAISDLKRTQRNKIKDTVYLEELRRRAEKAEKDFRHEIVNALKKAGSSKSKRLSLIRTHKQYKWIGELYPAVYTDERRVLFMTVKKFLGKNATLIEKSKDFLNDEFLRNMVIFIDEFDAAKQVILEHIFEKALSAQSDCLSLFRQLLGGLRPEHFSVNIRNSADNKLYDLIHDGKSIYEQYKLHLSYKTEGTTIDRQQNFLFHDGGFHTVLQKGKQYIRSHYDSEANQMTISFDTKDTYYRNHKDDDINIFSLLRDVQGYLNRFCQYLYQWAERFCLLVNAGRSDTEEDMTLENAQRSILHALNLSGPQIELLLGGLSIRRIGKRRKGILPENDFYSRGVSLFELEDSDSHHDSTDIVYIRMYDTAEKLIRFLAERTIVFGISATAQARTVLGNYDLEYLSGKLGAMYHTTDRELLDRVGRDMRALWEPYKSDKVRVHLETLSEKKETFDTVKECRSFMQDKDIAEAAANAIQLVTDDEYYLQRYCRLLRVMCRFWKEDKIRSLLCLGMALPKNDPNMSEKLLRELMNYAAMDAGCPEDPSALVILQSGGFDEDKEALLAELSEGKKRFVISTYATIGAGQNLQYPVSDPSGLIRLCPCTDPSDKRHFTKDFDALYLADITHLTVNMYEHITRKDMLLMLTQTEELYYTGEINYKTKDQLIKSAFRARLPEKNYAPNRIYQTDSFRIRATQLVIQAVGRMCRTYLKSPDIYLFIDEKLLEKLDVAEMNRRILPPEMKCILNARKQLGAEYSTEELRTLNLAERISTEGMWRIRSMLSKGWKPDSMELWGRLRDIVLRYPTAPENVHELELLVRELYITSGAAQNSYLFSQYSDFNDVIIDFSGNAAEFRNSGRLKIEGASRQTAVWKMSEKASGLPVILRYPGMLEHFREMGYATGFAPQLWIMSPVLFHNIYKGALGEAAGKIILERERGIKLHAINDPDRFEFFDYEMRPGVYVDFKNWKYTYLQDRETIRKEILAKLDAIGGKKVYIINIAAPDGTFPAVAHDERIVELPGLIGEDGQIIPGILDNIKKEDYDT